VKQGLPPVIASPPKAGEAISSPMSAGELMGTRQFYVYIMTNNRNTVLYTGVTNNIRKRVYEHRQKLVEGFTKKYNLVKLVYYESFGDPISAIKREKQIKGGSRKKKEELINTINKEWCDLYDEL
jgi:putative endonuclease